jgi:type II secretory pathway component GspD/PulD (secretin)
MQQQMMMMQQQMAMQQAQMGQQPGDKKKSEIYLVANQRRNSLIAHAPPDKMAIIAAFVKRIDIPGASDGLNALNTRMRVYRLTSLDPKKVVASIMAMDALEPTTRLETDEKNKAIIAHASLADHFIIQETLQKLDGSAREFDVIQLRRLKAEDVAGTIRTLMGTEKDKKEDRGRRSYYYWDPFGGNKKDEGNNDQLRVGANIQNNQLLIWSNEVERKDINKLLIKLGELPPEGGNRSQTRVIDANRSSETREYLEALKRNWERVSNVPLILPDAKDFEKPSEESTPANDEASSTGSEDLDIAPRSRTKKESSSKQDEAPKKVEDQSLGLAPRHEARIAKPAAFVASVQQQPPEEDGEALPADPPKTIVNPNRRQGQKPPAIEIDFDERGNLVLRSGDTEALDRLEQLMMEQAPPSRSYHVFRIRHARPAWIRLSLEDYFKDDSKKNNDRDAVYRWIFDMDSPKQEESAELGKKRKLKFISESDTSTIVVVGADEVQLKTIEQLIKLWDVAKPQDKQSLRYTKIVKVEYSKAQAIVDAMKEAFRDLLSSNDKALEKKAPEGAGGGNESKRDASDSIMGGGMSFDFSGRLSLGIERVTNSIIVSAKGEDLLELVVDMIEELDQNARPSQSIQVAKMNGTSTKSMEKALRALLRSQQPNDPNAQPGQQQQQGQPAGRPAGNNVEAMGGQPGNDAEF